MFSSSRHPISLFCLDDFGIDTLSFIERIKGYFHTLAWDGYISRQQKIEFLLEHAFRNQPVSEDINRLFCAYYQGTIDESALSPWIQLLNNEQQALFHGMQPTRRRAMQSYKVQVHDLEFSITPTPQRSFTQQKALSLKEFTDWRTLERVFDAPPTDMITPELNIILTQLIKSILCYHPTVTSMHVCVHFTQIVASPESTATNSPEGIHQDGMDYIVSALVIDRENVSGGKSVIFSENNACKILFETTLRPGYGIFQPDKDTDLWHVVEPITASDKTKSAFRSTIGFDFELKEL
jgi:hypothetical protein